jgi:hypothetical protein
MCALVKDDMNGCDGFADTANTGMRWRVPAFLFKPLPGDGAIFLPRPVTNQDGMRTQEYLGLDQKCRFAASRGGLRLTVPCRFGRVPLSARSGR